MSTDVRSEQSQVRLKKMNEIRNSGENPFRNGLGPNSSADEIHLTYADHSKEQLADLKKSVKIAGRILAVRDFGKASFIKIRDGSGDIQVFVQKDKLGEEGFVKFRTWDLGDIVFCSGEVFRTKTGELSIHADELVLLTKSLQPLPEKFHGLTDVELKYRHRYVDLIMNRDVRDVFRTRSKIIDEIRQFLNSRKYLEVETPMMQAIAGGAAARPFVTHHNTLDMELYLRIAPELFLKRLVVGGFERVYEINRNFRNEGISVKHNPEFTMLEFYQAYATFEDLMDLTETLFHQMLDKILGRRTLTYQGAELNFDGRWKRLKLEDAVAELSGYRDRSGFRDREKLAAYCASRNYPVEKHSGPGKLLTTIFEEEVERKLVNPTFVTHYPLEVSPLSRKNEQDPFLVDRFELIVAGFEVANGFSELNDPVDQMARFQEQAGAKAMGDEEATDIDADYVLALEYGMPPTAGEGIGIDRVTMLFTDSASIRDVILFPLLRPQGK